MSYQALYRSWRPQQFSELVGQPHVRQTLSNAISHGQVAHAYLFCGPRGTGKTSTAKVFARAVNCVHPNGIEPCNECESCQSITMGNNVDVEEIDAASNRGVDEIRQLREKVHYAPTSLKKKVYIVDEVHMLTTEAFNALLKTLEEPPEYVLFILATTEPHKIPSTIISRCQRFDFRRISTEAIAQHLQAIAAEEGWTHDERSIWRLAEAADGGLRNALNLLEQSAAFGQGVIHEEQVSMVVGGVETSGLLALIRALVDRDLLAVVQQLGNWYQAGKEASRITYDILQVIRDLFIVKLSPEGQSMSGRPLEGYRDIADLCSAEWLLQGIHKLGETYTQLRFVDQPRLALEASVLGLAGALPTKQVLIQQPEMLQPGLTGTAHQLDPVVAASTLVAEARNATTQGLVHQPAGVTAGVSVAPSVARAGATSGGAGSAKRIAKSTANRKREVLQDLLTHARPDILSAVQSNWAQILQSVKSNRIQTHAWLMNGEAVLTTVDAVVLCFQSRIHRDAVMKPDERHAIESALVQVLGQPMSIFALLRTDWEEFTDQSQQSEDNGDSSGDLAERAVQLFGKDLVEIRPEE